jgi:hypothetical protein
MKWTVVWLGTTEDELAEIWLRAEDRQAITVASHQIDQELRKDADQKGEDFYGDRVFQSGPLAVVFELSPDDRLVRITQVMRIRE